MGSHQDEQVPSTAGVSRTGACANRPQEPNMPTDIDLDLECTEEPISHAQVKSLLRRKNVLRARMSRLEAQINKDAETTQTLDDGSVTFASKTFAEVNDQNKKPSSKPVETILRQNAFENQYKKLPSSPVKVLTIGNDVPRCTVRLSVKSSSLSMVSPNTRILNPTPTVTISPIRPAPFSVRAIPLSSAVVSVGLKPIGPKPINESGGSCNVLKPPRLETFMENYYSNAQDPMKTDNLTNYPALKVKAKISRIERNSIVDNSRRAEIDAKLKTILGFSSAKLTEWLLESGLVLGRQVSEKGCELSLGFCFDKTKYQDSGGYIWFSRDDPSSRISVFRYSIFEQSSLSPFDIIKLIYHWCCQTSYEKVIAWVKVSLRVLDIFYCMIRCICSATIRKELRELTGTIELGMVPYKTSSDPAQYRLHILGVHPRSRPGVIRFFLIKSPKGSSIKERTELVVTLLHRIIMPPVELVIGSGLHKNTLDEMRPKSIKYTDPLYVSKCLNDILKLKIEVQNNNVLQQLLDEISFREMYGKSFIGCFENLVIKIAAETSEAGAASKLVLNCMSKIAKEPFFGQESIALSTCTSQAPPRTKRSKSKNVYSSKKRNIEDSNSSSDSVSNDPDL